MDEKKINVTFKKIEPSFPQPSEVIITWEEYEEYLELKEKKESSIGQVMKTSGTSLSYQDKEMFFWYGKWIVTKSDGIDKIIETEVESEAIKALLAD